MDKYLYNNEVQTRILSIYIRKEKLARDYIKPAYFTNPFLREIARMVCEIREKNPEVHFDEATLCAVVKRGLAEGRKTQAELWPSYKRRIRELFQVSVDRRDVAIDLAKDFGKKAKFQAALLHAGKYIDSKNYEAAVREFIELQEESEAEQVGRANKPKLASQHLHRFLSRDENDTSEEDHLVFPIVPKGGAVLLYGLPKELKSWFALELALDVAFGRKALGYFSVARAAKTLFVQVEDPEFLTRERIKQVMERRNFRKLHGLGMFKVVPRCSLNLSDPEWVGALEQELRAFKPELIVLDVLRRLFRGNVADSKETAEFLQTLDRLRDTFRCAIVLVHHARKAESAAIQSMALGSVNLTAWGDVLIYTNRKRQVGNASVAGLHIETKSSLLEQEDLEIVVDSELEPMVRVRPKGMDHVKRLQQLITETPGILQKQLQAKSRIPEKLLRKILKDGVEKNFWKEERGHGEGNLLGYYPSKRTEE